MKRLMQVLVVIAILISTPAMAPGMAFSSPGEETPPPPKIYVPHLASTASISGTVKGPDGKGLAGVTITTDDGKQAVTDQDGTYRIANPKIGERILTATAKQEAGKPGIVFAPSTVTVDVDGKELGVDFTALQEAVKEEVEDGGFESATSNWNYRPLVGTSYTAVRDTTVAHSGSASARTGIIDQTKNEAGWSSVRHPSIHIPADASSAILRLWLYHQTNESIAAALPDTPVPDFNAVFGDADAVVQEVDAELPIPSNGLDLQAVHILNTENVILERVHSARSNTRRWEPYEFDVTKWRGRSIKIDISTYNDGDNAGRVTALYVDDVSLTITSTGTETTPGCVNKLANSDFESTTDWNIPTTVFSARYSTDVAHAGTRSMKTGITTERDRFSYSDAWQTAYIPWDATSARLKMYYYPQSGEVSSLSAPAEPAAPSPAVAFGSEALADDVQYVLILNTGGFILDRLMWQTSNAQSWQYAEFNLNAYRGMTIRIQFGTYNNGVGGKTAMYVDDMIVETCTGGATPTTTPTATAVTPTATATTPAPGTCTNPILNGSFDHAEAWEIPPTRFSAGYYQQLGRTDTFSMRTGIINTANDRYSYSDFRQTVHIPNNTRSAQITFNLYLETEERPLKTPVIDQQVGALSMEALLAEMEAGFDAQYVLILDASGEWIDTLWWGRHNVQNWTALTYDLTRYAGRTISIQFGTYNNGLVITDENGLNPRHRVTSMFVDDVTMEVCP